MTQHSVPYSMVGLITTVYNHGWIAERDEVDSIVRLAERDEVDSIVRLAEWDEVDSIVRLAEWDEVDSIVYLLLLDCTSAQ